MSYKDTEGGWIGVDLDGTLAVHEDNWTYPDIGAPVIPMVQRVKAWLAQGKDVRILTARVHPEWGAAAIEETRQLIEEWCQQWLNKTLTITCSKDSKMIELWDDRAVHVVPNTGMTKEELARVAFRF